MYTFRFSSNQIKNIISKKLVKFDELIDNNEDLTTLKQVHIFYLLMSNFLKKGMYEVSLTDLVVLNSENITVGEYNNLTFSAELEIPIFVLKPLLTDTLKEIKVREEIINDKEKFEATLAEINWGNENKDSFVKGLQKEVARRFNLQRLKIEQILSIKTTKTTKTLRCPLIELRELFFLPDWKDAKGAYYVPSISA